MHQFDRRLTWVFVSLRMESAASPLCDTNKFEGTHQTHFSLIKHMTDKVMVRFFHYINTDCKSHIALPSKKLLEHSSAQDEQLCLSSTQITMSGPSNRD
ncbi:MAG TPA: hypothetical protein VFP45_04345 [Candidatus Nitrosotalea sp.]|nr:hypothetical protein [Candidatus Nitrosotalea sp.]